MCLGDDAIEAYARSWWRYAGVDGAGGCLGESVGFERLKAGADESDHVVDHCHCLF